MRPALINLPLLGPSRSRAFFIDYEYVFKGAPMKETRRLTKLGKHSYYVVVPAYMVRGLKWKERMRLSVALDSDKIVVERERRAKR